MFYWISLVMAIFSSVEGLEPEYLSIYRRIPQHYLKAMPQKVFEHTTVQSCARYCVTETTFECKSFDYDNSQRECHLHNHTHHEPLIGLQEALDVDHYRTAYEKLFNRIPNHVIIMNHKRKIQGLRVEECARRCINELTFRCAGFDYWRPKMACLLTDKIPSDVGGLKKRANTDYYERKTNGPLSRFINYGYGSLQTVEGVQTHTKIVLGVNLDACAQLCLAETAFECTSFDFVFGEQSCQLSKYIAAHVHGMRTEFAKRHRVMHFELIDEYLNHFYPTPFASIIGHNDKTFRKVTPDTCARKCLEEREFICRSFDYQIQKGTCLLSHVTGSDAGGLYTLEGAHVHHFEMKPSLDCGAVLHRERGTIASPNWPRHYSHHLNCTWSLHVSDFKIVRIEIHHIDLGRQTQNTCSNQNDILSIAEQTSRGHYVRCIQNYETEIVTKTNDVNITFTTNAQTDAHGFRLFYFADWPCEDILTKDNGEFASPRWPNSYPAMSNCHWAINGPEGAKIILRFNSIQLEDHTGSNCMTAYDRIDIYEGDPDNGKHLTTICGLKSSLSFTSSGNSLFVRFVSDSRVQTKGFHASYRFITYATSTSIFTSTTSSQAASTANILNKESDLSNSKSNKDNNVDNIKEEIDGGTEEGERDVIKDVNKSNKTGLQHDNEQGSNSSMSVHLAMVGSRDKGSSNKNRLDAEFNEPPYVVYDDVDDMIDKGGDGRISDDIGKGNRPELPPEVVQPEMPYTAIIWGVILSVCVTCLAMTVAILFVCRYYRRRLPKLRQRPEQPLHADESLSLYQKDRDPNDDHSVGRFPDEADIEDAARLPLPSDHTAPPDVEFHNPLYLESPNPAGSSNRQHMLDLNPGTMPTESPSGERNPCFKAYTDSDGCTSDRSCGNVRDSNLRDSLSDIESSVLSEDTASTALLLVERPNIHIDCFTTV